MLMQRITEGLGISHENIQKNTSLEILRIVKEKKEQCCDLLSYMTARNEYYAVFDNDAFESRKALFMKQEDSDIASLVINILTADKTIQFIKHLGIDKEQKYMSDVMKVKEQSDKNSYTFGGLSMFGSLIDVAMERYKMTKRQVVWEIDYTSLRLLLADRVNSVYVTDEERKKIHVPKDRTKVNGDDREAMMKAIKSQSWD